MGDCIGIDISAGACHKVFITYSGGDKCENKLEITKLMNEEIKKDNKYNLSLTALLPSKFVFEQIKACINPSIYDLAYNDIKNEMYDEDNNYPARLEHTYPISFSENKKELTVSLVLLDDIPKDNILAKYFFQVCGLEDAVKDADEALEKVKFFVGGKEKKDDDDNSTQPAKSSSTYKSDSIDDFDYHYSFEMAKKIFDKEDLNMSHTRMAFICFANTIRGQIVLNKVKTPLTKDECTAIEEEEGYSCERRELSIQYSPTAFGRGTTIDWLGKGRFSPFTGYMPGGVILAHEIGHTVYGEYYSDYIGDLVNENSGKPNNLEINENPMRLAYGMNKRDYYTVFKFETVPRTSARSEHNRARVHNDKRGCYDEKGVKLKTKCPEFLEYLKEHRERVELGIAKETYSSSSKEGQTPLKWEEK
jgi:hypothetical protein